MSLSLDYTLNLTQRLDWAHSANLHAYSPVELELIANYILYADKPKTTSSPNKYTQSKCKPAGLLQDEENLHELNSTYTKPRPIIHLEDEFISQYTQSIAWLKLVEEQIAPEFKWRIRKWRIEHNLDMGTANAQLYPTMSLHSGLNSMVEIDLDTYVDLTNSFHVSKVLQFYSQLRQSEHSKLWMEWVDEIIEKTPMYPWQKHLLVRRIDGAKQITIGRELGEYFGKIVSPSTMSQALRTMYRQIAIAAEKEVWAFYNKDNEKEWRVCKKCGEKKLVKYDFYESKPYVCKQCAKGVREK